MKYMHSAVLLITLITSVIVCSQDTDYYQLAEKLRAQGCTAKAQLLYEQALTINPHHLNANFNLACLLFERHNFEEAVRYFNKTIELDPACVQAHYNMGMCLKDLKKTGEALLAFNKATDYCPTYTNAYLQIGSILEEINKGDMAFGVYKKILSFDTHCFMAHYRLGLLYRKLNQFDEAITHLRTAVTLDYSQTMAIIELANTLHLQDGSEKHSQECISLYTTALDRMPNNLGVLYNLGYTYKRLGCISQALEIYNRVIALSPDYATARFSRSLTYLALGDFEKGWQEYEWRWKTHPDNSKKFPHITVWDGTDLHGKTIIVYCEQGLGDTFQFIRFVPVLKNLGATVIVETQKPLKQLLSLCPYIDAVYAYGEKIPDCDYQIPLMSLPRLLKTTLETISSDLPYIFAKPEYVEYWRDQLSADTNFKIGICWQGNANYSTQALRQVVALKSLNVKHFEPIMQMDRVSVYNLQMISGIDQISQLSDPSLIKTFGKDFDESHGRFMDTLAVMKNMDLIITIDTSTCHAAGALKVPVWVLLPKPADWRWMLDRNDTPWYPTMRLFRQHTAGNWDEVIQDIVRELQPLVSTKNIH